MKENRKEKQKLEIEYYQKLSEKAINIAILSIGGTASTFLSYSSKPSEAKLFLIILGVFISVTFTIVAIKLIDYIKKLISKL